MIPTRRDFLKSATALAASPYLIDAGAAQQPAPGSEVFADFESGAYDGWTLTGNCWTKEPHQASTIQGITGFQGKRFLCTLHPKLGNAATGKAVSREFTIEKPFINFLIGGGNHPGEACLNLVVDGKVVRTETGSNSAELRPITWDVSVHIRKSAHFEVVDKTSSTDRGYVMVDELRNSSVPRSRIDNPPPIIDFNEHISTMHLDTQARIQRAIDATLANTGAPGATMTLVINGVLRSSAAGGIRKLGSPEPILPTDPMHIGSNGKGLTALLVGRLIERGLLHWDSTPRQVFKSTVKVGSSLGDVPLLLLLLQRSGINEPIVHLPKYSQVDVSEGRRRYAEDALEGPPAFAPGSKYEYRGANYITAGAMCEVAAGKSYEELLRTEVFEPLCMRKAGFWAMGTGTDVSVPWQHQLVGNHLSPIYHDNPRFSSPGGALHCSALDLANVAMARIAGSLGVEGYLSSQTWKRLHTPPPNEGYACGIAVSGIGRRGIRDMSHGGSNNLSCSDWWVREQGRIIAVAMINSPCKALSELLESVVAIGKSLL